MASYLKSGEGVSRKYDEAKEKARPLTPRSERPRRTWGSLSMSLQTAQGLCAQPKCVKREEHEGNCWPSL